jgi:hypothetical protein
VKPNVADLPAAAGTSWTVTRNRKLRVSWDVEGFQVNRPLA